MKKEIKLKVFAVTNRGGKLLKPLNYFGYRIPIYFTKKEATKAKEELNNLDTPSEIKKRVSGFERKIVSGYFKYK